MKILITGGCGFIGSALVRYIINNTDFKVINIDKLTYAGNQESLSSVSNHKNYYFEQVDICDNKKIENILEKYKPNYIMHLAAETHVDRSIENPINFINTNVLGTFNLLEQSLKYYEKLNTKNKNIFKFHHISTDEVYGDLEKTNSFFTESTPYAPSSPYSASKASSDHFVRAWNRTYNLPTIITNCSNNYGPYHFPEKLIPHIIISAIKGVHLPIYGDGLQIRDWLYVEDHAEALLKVLVNGEVGETYNIGGNNEKTNIEVVNQICLILEELAPEKKINIKKYTDLIKFVDDRPGHDKRYAIDITKIHTNLDWLPKETFDSGLYKTVSWYIENEDWWGRLISGEYELKRIGKKD